LQLTASGVMLQGVGVQQPNRPLNMFFLVSWSGREATISILCKYTIEPLFGKFSDDP
jgi:hypothetical protein